MPGLVDVNCISEYKLMDRCPSKKTLGTQHLWVGLYRENRELKWFHPPKNGNHQSPVLNISPLPASTSYSSCTGPTACRKTSNLHVSVFSQGPAPVRVVVSTTHHVRWQGQPCTPQRSSGCICWMVRNQFQWGFKMDVLGHWGYHHSRFPPNSGARWCVILYLVGLHGQSWILKKCNLLLVIVMFHS